MDWFANSLNLAHSSSYLLCPWCKACRYEEPESLEAAIRNIDVCPWNDINDGALWRGTTWEDADAWVEWMMGYENLHPIFTLPAVSILNVCADSMHIVDLGVAHHVLGNAIALLVKHDCPCEALK